MDVRYFRALGQRDDRQQGDAGGHERPREANRSIARKQRPDEGKGGPEGEKRRGHADRCQECSDDPPRRLLAADEQTGNDKNRGTNRKQDIKEPVRQHFCNRRNNHENNERQPAKKPRRFHGGIT